MDETTFSLYEIAFYPASREGMLLQEGNLKTSLQTYDNMIMARAAFLDVAKTYLKELLSVDEETRFVVCAELNPDIKRNHKVYPTNSIVLVQQEDRITVFEKKTIVNAGYIYNSESHRVTQLGTIAIMALKLSPCLTNRVNCLKEKEKNLEILLHDTNKKRLHAIELMRELTHDKTECEEREERLANRERMLNQREQMLNEWDGDLEEWENNLESKSNDIQKQIIEYQTEITILEAKLSDLQARAMIPTNIHSESESDDDVEFIPSKEQCFDTPQWVFNQDITGYEQNGCSSVWNQVPEPPKPPKAPVVKNTVAPPPPLSYLEELEEYLTKRWGKIETEHNEENDSSYLQYIERVINPGKKKVVFGKVKTD